MKQYAAIINESGIEILFIDFCGLSGDEFITAIEQVKKFCLQLPPDKHYSSITDMSNAKTNNKIREAMKSMEQLLKTQNRGDVPKKIKVVIGIKGIQKIIAGAITQGITYVNTKREAIDHIKQSV